MLSSSSYCSASEVMPAARPRSLVALLAGACAGAGAPALAGCPARLLEVVEGGGGDGPAHDEVRLVDAGLALLAQQRPPLFVVPALGVYRGGKSMLLNRLQGRQAPYAEGFRVGHGQGSHTRGVDICPEEVEGLGTVVWMDTEGLFSWEDAHGAHGSKIFSLALLVSSAVLLNSVKVLNASFFAFFGQQQQLARALREGLAAQGLPVDALLPAGVSAFWLLSEPVAGGSRAGHGQLEEFLAAPGDEVRARVRRDFAHQLHEVPRATDDSRLWRQLQDVPDAGLLPEYVASCRELRDKVLLALRGARPRTASDVVAQLRMWAQLVQTGRFSGPLAQGAFEEAQASRICDLYGRTAAEAAGVLPSRALGGALEAARRAADAERQAAAEAFHLGAGWSRRLEECCRGRRADLERSNMELVLRQWKADARGIAEEGGCFFLDRLGGLLAEYESAYATGLGPRFGALAWEHGAELQRAGLVECVRLGDVLRPLLPLVAPYLLGSVCSARRFRLAAALLAAYCALQHFGRLPPWLDAAYPVLQRHPPLLRLAVGAPPGVWASARRALRGLGVAWHAQRAARCAAPACQAVLGSAQQLAAAAAPEGCGWRVVGKRLSLATALALAAAAACDGGRLPLALTLWREAGRSSALGAALAVLAACVLGPGRWLLAEVWAAASVAAEAASFHRRLLITATGGCAAGLALGGLRSPAPWPWLLPPLGWLSAWLLEVLGEGTTRPHRLACDALQLAEWALPVAAGATAAPALRRISGGASPWAAAGAACALGFAATLAGVALSRWGAERPAARALVSALAHSGAGAAACATLASRGAPWPGLPAHWAWLLAAAALGLGRSSALRGAAGIFAATGSVAALVTWQRLI